MGSLEDTPLAVKLLENRLYIIDGTNNFYHTNNKTTTTDLLSTYCQAYLTKWPNNFFFSGQSTNPATLAFSGRSINGTSTDNNLFNSVALSQGNILKVCIASSHIFIKLTNETSKVGAIGSPPACSLRDRSSNLARVK